MYWRFGARQAGPIAEARQQRDAAGSHPISYENMFRIGTGFSSPIPETDGCRLAKLSANRAAWRTSS